MEHGKVSTLKLTVYWFTHWPCLAIRTICLVIFKGKRIACLVHGLSADLNFVLLQGFDLSHA
jgi:hypothetical protein